MVKAVIVRRKNLKVNSRVIENIYNRIKKFVLSRRVPKDSLLSQYRKENEEVKNEIQKSEVLKAKVEKAILDLNAEVERYNRINQNLIESIIEER